ncbi:MAG: DNA repair protein RecO [Oscillospiraceae bacterium]|nr:DNA repair protein RecO [Oscillospiraceae bacterium]
MYQKVKGIVLRESPYRDYDKILTLLTVENGLMTLKARGVTRSKSLLKSACQILTYSEFTVYERQGFHTITEAQPIAMFAELRTDIERLSLASYFAQAAEVTAQADSPDPELLSLLLHAMHALCSGKPQLLVKAAFELRLASITGYAPDVDGCAVCGSTEPDRFHVAAGELRCAKCGSADGGLRMPVSAPTLAALRHVLGCEVGRVFSFSIGDASIKELSDISETYLLTRLERGFFTLDFYKSLLIT